MARIILERADLLPRLAETFRRHGYHGSSVALIAAETGAGRSSLYHFFPGGKDDMAEAVLEDIAAWFEAHIFAPLQQGPATEALPAMFTAVAQYFASGQRICLLGAFALDAAKDRFASRIQGYFSRWDQALQACLIQGGHGRPEAIQEASEILAAIQGGIVLARASADPAAFHRVVTAAQLRAMAGLGTAAPKTKA